MNDLEKKTYTVLLNEISVSSNTSNTAYAIIRLREFVEVVAIRIKAEKGKGEWC